MLATLHPNAYMDSFRYKERHSDYTSIEREPRHRPSSPPPPRADNNRQQHQQHQQQQQQQLPSFREIVPPALHSAIDSVADSGTQAPSSGEQGFQTNTGNQRSAGSGLSSPIYSQSSSMPDSFDDLGNRNYEAISYPPTRSNSTWSSSTAYTGDMATSYQRQPFYSQSFGTQKQFSGLPPMRDAPADGLYNSGGAYSMYSGSPQASTAVDHPFNRRPSTYTGSLSSTYPGTDRNYHSMDGSYRPPYAQSFQPPRQQTAFTYPESYSPGGYGGMPSGMTYPSMDNDGRNKRRRGNLPKHTTDLLRNWLAQHIDHPYPTEEEKQYLMGQTGLNLNQISNWFINARRRHWPAMKKEAEQAKGEKGS